MTVPEGRSGGMVGRFLARGHEQRGTGGSSDRRGGRSGGYGRSSVVGHGVMEVFNARFCPDHGV